MVSRRRFVLLAGLAASLSSCAPAEGEPTPVELVVLDPHGGAPRLETVTLDTLVDIHTLAGERFSFFGGTTVAPAHDLLHAADAETFAEQQEAALEQYVGPPAAPRLVWDGDRYVARDYTSLYMVSAFHRFEQVFSYFDEGLGESSRAVTTHAPVVVDSDLVFEVPGLPPDWDARVTSDNAFFFSLLDGWGILRAGAQQGIPLGADPGIIAHEFGHRVFFHRVFPSPGPEDLTTRMSELGDAERRSSILIRGINEGVADLYAVGFTRDPGFLGRPLVASDSPLGALERDSVLNQRHLEGPFADEATYDNLADGSFAASDLCVAVSLDFTNQNFNPYCIGTVFARSVWDAVDRDPDRLVDEVLRPLGPALAVMGGRLEDTGTFDVDLLLDALAVTVEAPVRAALCEAFSERFASLVTVERVPACF